MSDFVSSTAHPPRGPLDPLFEARSVALVGLSADAARMTGAPLVILRQAGFDGRIFPVNPKRDEIGGLTCYASIDALPEAPDVALILLAARHVPDAVRACARKGIRGVVVLSSGFEETADGETHARELARAAAETGLPVVGPNCEGVWSVGRRLMLTFGSAARREVLHRAPIAVLSQSGAMAGAIARHLQESAIGCEYVVSVGNETVLTIADYLEWLIDQDVRIVLLFIEGLRDGERLLWLLDRARQKGIVVAALKSGNSQAGIKAAASHTGKVASAYAVYRALLDEASVVQMTSLTDLIEFADVLNTSLAPPARGEQGGVAVFSIPGGTRALTVDLLETHRVPLSTFDASTSAALAAALPPFAGTDNPTDLTGQVLSDPGLFDRCLRIIADDPHTEALIVQVANRGPRDAIERVELLAAIVAERRLPMVISFLGDALPPADKKRFRERGILCARDPAEAANFLGWLYAARDAAQRPGLDMRTSNAKVAAVAAPAGWTDVCRYLEACGIGVPASRIVAADEDVVPASAALAFPLALKASPDAVDHKTELGLVALDLRDAAALRDAAHALRSRMGDTRVPLLVQEMAGSGVEVLMAALRNPDFGPILALGSGGIGVELYRDIAYLALPTSPARVRAALATLRLGTLLDGFRGKPRADVDALVAAAVAFGERFVSAQPPLAELEINPLFVRSPGAAPLLAVDALVKPGIR
jgi:acyl-CoA synthetase (NDP forming)